MNPNQPNPVDPNTPDQPATPVAPQQVPPSVQHLPVQPPSPNPQTPPAPAPRPVQSIGPTPVAQSELPPNNPDVVDEQIKLKKNQARKLLIAAGIFISIFVLGVIAVVVVALGNQEGTPALTTDEQIVSDVNTLGLGVINYTNNRSSDFSLEPEKVGELKVSYLPIEFQDPRTNEPYVLTTEIPEAGELQYVLGGVCNDDDSVSQSGKGDNFAIRAQLENGTLYCVEKGEVTSPKTPQP